jgi:Domain of unknown function (DUF222)
VEDRLAVLSQARPWLLSTDELVTAFDQVQALVVEANAVLVRLVREIDARAVANRAGAANTAVWIRDRHRVSVRAAHRLVKTAADLEGAPDVLGSAVAAGVVNRDQAEVILRALGRLPRAVGVDVRQRAAAELVACCTDLDPALVEIVGAHVLRLVAPDEADDAERAALDDAEAVATQTRHFTLSPDADGVGVRLSGRLTAEAPPPYAPRSGRCAPRWRGISGRPGNAARTPWSRCAGWR